jgi:hypothetical protein
MSLWVSPHVSVVRPGVQILHSRDMEFCSGTHRVAPEAMTKLKAQVEAKFYMYYFGLH